MFQKNCIADQKYFDMGFSMSTVLMTHDQHQVSENLRHVAFLMSGIQSGIQHKISENYSHVVLFIDYRALSSLKQRKGTLLNINYSRCTT
jgi:ABC-type sulfate/molybdate transport systems ATPase subunit